MADEKRTFSGERNSKRNNRVISPSKYLLDDAKVSRRRPVCGALASFIATGLKYLAIYLLTAVECPPPSHPTWRNPLAQHWGTTTFTTGHKNLFSLAFLHILTIIRRLCRIFSLYFSFLVGYMAPVRLRRIKK